MGKSYVENSLKRFLKRKVKITLGLVVAFMITGVCAFAEGEKPKNVGEHNKNFEGITNTKDNLTGINNSEQKFNDFTEKEVTIGGNKYFVKMENNTLSFRKESDTAPTINSMTIESKDISNALKEKIDEILANLENPDTSDSNVNNSILASTQTGNVTNNGIINSGTGAAQIANSDNTTIINNGIINTSGYYTQYSASGSSNATIINNGLIYANNGVAQYGFSTKENVKLINKGIIKSNQQGQIITGNNSQAINYGIIEVIATNNPAQSGGQKDKVNNVLLNYGIITSKRGQIISEITNKAYNYGVINSKEGILANSEAKGYNYGVIKVDNATNAFKGDVTNKGIVIADSGELTAQYNTGILLDSEYNVRGEDTKVFKSGETVTDFAGNNTFGESIIKGYVKNASVNIDNTQGKVIGAVVTEKLDKAVFNYSGDDLFLKDTTITGYFEKDGTLLDVGTGNLTLGGDTNITAVKGDLSLDVTAVQLGENGKITIMDEAKINGFIKGNENSEITFTQSKGEYKVDGGKVAINIGKADLDGSKYQQYFDVTLNGTTSGVTDSKVSEIEISTENGVKDLTNKLVIGKDLTVGKNVEGNSIYDTNKTNKEAELELTIENIHNIEGNILLGAGKDTVIVTNNDNHVTEHLKTEINLGEGTEDKFVVVGNTVDDEGKSKNIFSYKVVNTEIVELRGGTWGDWNKAEGTIGFTDSTKAGEQPNLVLGNSTTMNITLNAEGNHGSDFANYVGTKLGLNHAVITGTGNGSVIKYLIDEKGFDTANLSTKKYSFGDGVSYKDSPIFNISSTKGDGVNISVKTAGEMGLSGQDRIIYDAYVDQIKVGTANKEVIDQINGYDTSEEFAGLIKDTSVTGEAYYTAGSVVTMDIADTYLSAVEDFTKRAGKGEWLAQGKYINSDTEFDGGSKVKGYDGDVTGTVGMIEYGFTDNTSYGAVFGMGDSKMDIDGGGKLDGDNTYAGLYMKHRTQNGIELVANLGYVENDMDSVLRNDFKFNNDISSNGKTFEKGTADSSAVILSVKGRKDYRITDTVKVQPILGARATFINQEKAENPEMHFTIKEQDIIVVEGTAGMGIAKEFALSQGKLELNAGVEYTFAATSSTNDAEYTLFDETTVKLEEVDTAENTGTAFAGFDYEHESGVGFNGKYEMMWSDKGDDSRVTAGISYRF